MAHTQALEAQLSGLTSPLLEHFPGTATAQKNSVGSGPAGQVFVMF